MISFDLQVRDFPFNAQSQAAIEAWRLGQREYGTNWPVVDYIRRRELRNIETGGYFPRRLLECTIRPAVGQSQAAKAVATIRVLVLWLKESWNIIWQ